MREMASKELQFLQTLGIILVVVGHSLPQNYSDSYLFRTIYSFHMPLFIFLSGFLFRINWDKYDNQGFVRFIGKKATRLLLPYYIISTIAYFPKALLSAYAVRPYKISFQGYLHGLIYPGDNPIVFFWFLPTLFFIFSLCYPLQRLIQKSGLLSYVFVLLVLAIFENFLPLILILNISGIVHYIFFFISGCFIATIKPWISIPQRKVGSLVLGFFGVGLYLILIYFRIETSLPMVMALLGIFTSMILAEFIRFPYFKIIGIYSYQIYLISWFPQVLFRILYYDLGNLDPAIGVALSSIITITFSIGIAYLVDQKIKHKTIKIILGM